MWHNGRRVDRCDLSNNFSRVRNTLSHIFVAFVFFHGPPTDSRYTSNFSDPSRCVPLIDARSASGTTPLAT